MFDEGVVGLRHLGRQAGDRLRRTDAGNDVLALGVRQVLAVERALAGRWAAREADAGAAARSGVAEDHRHDADGGAQVVRDVLVVAVGDRARVRPALEHGADGEAQLLPRVCRERLRACGGDLLKAADDLFEVGLAQVCVRGGTRLRPRLVQHRLEALGVGVKRHLGEELDEAPVRVQREAPVVGRLRQALDRLVVEAEVEDRVHHSRHRELRARADGDEQRVVRVAEAPADSLLDLLQRLLHLLPEAVRQLLVQAGELAEPVGGYDEARRYGQAQAGHLAEVRTLTSEQIAHPGVAVSEAINEPRRRRHRLVLLTRNRPAVKQARSDLSLFGRIHPRFTRPVYT